MPKSLGMMTPRNPRWQEFFDLLEGPQGCNFHRADPKDPESVRWACDSKADHPATRKILKSMGATDAEIEQSIGFFVANGGYCDCEVLFNVESSSGMISPRHRKRPVRITGKNPKRRQVTK